MKHPHFRKNLAVGGLISIAFAMSGYAAAQVSQSSEAGRGKRLYHDHGCYGCHGFNGETGVRRLVGTGSPILEKPDVFVAYLRLRADLQPMLPSTAMPSFSVGSLSDADALAIYAYVRTFSLNAPTVESIPAFKKILDAAKAPYKPSR